MSAYEAGPMWPTDPLTTEWRSALLAPRRRLFSCPVPRQQPMPSQFGFSSERSVRDRSQDRKEHIQPQQQSPNLRSPQFTGTDLQSQSAEEAASTRCANREDIVVINIGQVFKSVNILIKLVGFDLLDQKQNFLLNSIQQL